MEPEFNKRAANAVIDAVSSYVKNHPNIVAGMLGAGGLGALGGALLPGSDDGAEEPKSRILRRVKNALIGGALGAGSAAALGHGFNLLTGRQDLPASTQNKSTPAANPTIKPSAPASPEAAAPATPSASEAPQSNAQPAATDKKPESSSSKEQPKDDNADLLIDANSNHGKVIGAVGGAAAGGAGGAYANNKLHNIFKRHYDKMLEQTIAKTGLSKKTIQTATGALEAIHSLKNGVPSQLTTEQIQALNAVGLDNGAVKDLVGANASLSNRLTRLQNSSAELSRLRGLVTGDLDGAAYDKALVEFSAKDPNAKVKLDDLVKNRGEAVAARAEQMKHQPGTPEFKYFGEKAERYEKIVRDRIADLTSSAERDAKVHAASVENGKQWRRKFDHELAQKEKGLATAPALKAQAKANSRSKWNTRLIGPKFRGALGGAAAGGVLLPWALQHQRDMAQTAKRFGEWFVR